MSNILEVIQAVLQDCISASSPTSLEEADHINFQLECCNRYLAGFISDTVVLSDGDSVNHDQLRELHQCINSLQDIWRIKLARIEGNSAVRSEGRPRKLVNTELVVCLQ